MIRNVSDHSDGKKKNLRQLGLSPRECEVGGACGDTRSQTSGEAHLHVFADQVYPRVHRLLDASPFARFAAKRSQQTRRQAPERHLQGWSTSAAAESGNDVFQDATQFDIVPFRGHFYLFAARASSWQCRTSPLRALSAASRLSSRFFFCSRSRRRSRRASSNVDGGSGASLCVKNT